MQAARLVIRLFGSPEFTLDGRELPLPRPRCVSILALLALRRKTLTRASVASTVWPDELVEPARSNLRRHIHQLSLKLPPVDGIEWLLSDAKTIGWNFDAPAWIDVLKFEEAAADKRRVVEAIELYRGDLLEGAYDEFVIAERERLRTTYVDACFSAAIAARRERQFREAIAYGDRILAEEPFREDALRLGMALRYESGDRTSALGVFETFARRLANEMGVTPTAETLALRDAVLGNAPIALGGIDERENLDAFRTQSAALPFVGREEERTALEAAWHLAARRRGNVVFVGGAPGMGKTRLVAEIASLVASQGGRALVGETTAPEAYPYEAIVDALRRGLRAVLESPPGEPWLAALGSVMPEIAAAAPTLPALEPLDDDKSRTRLFEAFVRTVERLAKARPLLLVLEDLHWAGSATIEALDAMARRLASLPALVVVTYRSDEVPTGHPLGELRRRLQDKKLATVVDINPLERADVDAIVQNVRIPGERDETLTASLYARSEGNPLFVGLLVRELAETGRFERAEPDIAHTIAGRVASLESHVQTLARAASVAGRSFTSDILAMVLGWADSQVFDALRELVERGLVRTSDTSAFAYTFTHGLIETSIYATISDAERLARHRRIAAVLDKMEPKDRQALSSIARHWKLGGEPERAAREYLAAATAARAVYAYAEAIALARSALELEAGPQRRFEALLLIVDGDARVTGPTQWESDVAALHDAAESLGPRERFAAAHAFAKLCSRSGRRDRQREAIDSMLALAENLSPQERSMALYELGQLEFQQAHMAAAASLLERAIAAGEQDAHSESHARMLLVRTMTRMGRRSEAEMNLAAMRDLCERDDVTPALRITALEAERWIANDAGDAARTLAVGKAMLPLALASGDMLFETWAHNAIAYGNLQCGSLGEIYEHLDRGYELCDRLNWPAGMLGREYARAATDTHFGLAAQALDRLDRLVSELERIGAVGMLCTAQLNRAECYMRLGDTQAALTAASDAFESAERSGSTGFMLTARFILGVATLEAGDARAAIVHLEQALELRGKNDSPARSMEVQAAYLEALLDAGRDVQAHAVAAELAEVYAKQTALSWRPTQVLCALARAAQRAGNPKAAKGYAERGKARLAFDVRRIGDERAAEAFRALPFNRALLSM